MASRHRLPFRAAGRVSCPALIVVGEFDPGFPPAAARVLRDGIPGARMHVVPGASHVAPLEKPDGINAHVVACLAEVG